MSQLEPAADPLKDDAVTDIKSAVLQAKYDGMSARAIADALNAETVEVARTSLSQDEVLGLLDAAELATTEIARAFLLGHLLVGGRLDLASKRFALLAALLPPNSKAALEAKAAELVTVPLTQKLGLDGPIEYGMVATVRGFDPDIVENGEKRNP